MQLDGVTMSMNRKSSIARAIAPEDIRAGMYIALLHEIDFGCGFCWEVEPALMAARGPRLRIPCEADPYHVKAVSLPFILVQQADGDVTTLDARRYRFARLPSAFGRKAFESMRKEKDAEQVDAKKEEQTT
jgi:hypothetical protein